MGPQGEQGPAGPIGPQGPQGVQGPAGAGISRDHTYPVSVSVIIDPGQTGGAGASCNDSNDILLSGGYDGVTAGLDTYRSQPLPYFANQTWVAYALNYGSIPATLTVSALCLQVD